MGVIFVLSSLPTLPELPGKLEIGDKTAHMVAYLFLAALWLRSLAWKRRPGAWTVGFAFLMTVGFGLTDEWHQSFVPGRTVDFLDWLADALGAALGVSVLAIYGKRQDY